MKIGGKMSDYSINILSETENKLLNRKEIEFEITHPTSSTPKRLDIRKKIAAQFNKEENLTLIIQLDTKYGIGLTKGQARLYENATDIKKIEPAYMIKRNMPKEKKEEE